MTTIFAALLLLAPRIALRSDLPPVARLYASRIGAPAQLPVERPVRTEWRVRRYGLDGVRIDELGPLRARRTQTLGPIEETVTTEGSRVVRRDLNGQVTMAAGMDRDEVLAGLAIDNGTWLLDHTKLTVLPPDAQGRPRLRVALAAPVELTFSKDGELLSRRIFRRTEPEETTYDDWAVVEGRRIARHQVIHERNVVEPTELFFTRLAALDANAPFPTPAAREDVHFPSGQSEIALPLSVIHDRWLLASVDIGGRSGLFLVDTGAEGTVVDRDFAVHAGMKPFGGFTQTAGMFSRLEFVRTPGMSIGGAHIDAQTVIALDIAHSPLASVAPGVVGILGYDFLSRFVVVVDYPASRFALVARSAFHPRADDASIPCTIDGSTMLIAVQVAGRPAHFILDTGSGGGINVQHVGNQKQLLGPGADRFYDPAGLSFGSGAPSGTWPSTADFSVGPYLWKQAPITVLDEASAKGSSFDSDGNLGAAYLRRFRVSIDFTGGRLWLAQGIPFVDRPYASYGIRLERRARVRSVAADGPAARAQIKKGDEVVSINGLAAGPGHFIEQALVDPAPDETITIVLRSGGATKTVTLHAERLPRGAP